MFYYLSYMAFLDRISLGLYRNLSLWGKNKVKNNLEKSISFRTMVEKFEVINKLESF